MNNILKLHIQQRKFHLYLNFTWIQVQIQMSSWATVGKRFPIFFFSIAPFKVYSIYVGVCIICICMCCSLSLSASSIYTHHLAYYSNIFVRCSSICVESKNIFEYVLWSIFAMVLNVIHTTSLDIFRRSAEREKQQQQQEPQTFRRQQNKYTKWL